MTSPGCLFILGDARERADDAAGWALRSAVDRLDGAEVVADAAAAARLATDASDDRVGLAVIGPGVDGPLAAARALRRADAGLALAFVVTEADASATENRIGLLPELAGATVVVADGAADDLAERLRDLAISAARRRGVRGALDAINQQLLQEGDEHGGRGRQSVSASYLAALVRHVPEAIVAVDADGSVVALNDAATAMLGVDPHRVEGRGLEEVLSASGVREINALVASALAGTTTSGAEVRLGVGEDRLVTAVTAAPVRDHRQQIAGAVLLVRDVTEQRRTQQRLQELQKAESLATLAGGVAHDFNNLLVAVRGWAELAADEPDDTEFVATALERIRVSADRAGQLARAMLVYGGRGRFELRPVDLGQLTREVIDLLHGTVNRKTSVVLELDPDLPAAHADVTQLRQVVTNLVTNAAEAVGDDPGTITVRSSAPAELPPDLAREVTADPAERYVVLEVADTGPGMDEDTRRRVFEPFFTTKFEGRGLGLAASHGIVRAHGGALTVEAAPGRGATFRMALPAGPGAGA